jgi:hypothetical protein
MKLTMGSQTFIDVQVPVLWGTRAVIQDKANRLSVIDLSGGVAKLEILGDKPAQGVEFSPTVDGFNILMDGEELYAYSPDQKLLTSISLGLPHCQISQSQIQVGSNVFSCNMIAGFEVGILVTKDHISVGAVLPRDLVRPSQSMAVTDEVSCPVCGRSFSSFLNLARHMVLKDRPSGEHIQWLEGLLGRPFVEFGWRSDKQIALSLRRHWMDLGLSRSKS